MYDFFTLFVERLKMGFILFFTKWSSDIDTKNLGQNCVYRSVLRKVLPRAEFIIPPELYKIRTLD